MSKENLPLNVRRALRDLRVRGKGATASKKERNNEKKKREGIREEKKKKKRKRVYYAFAKFYAL